MRVIKKITTPFIQAEPDKAIIMINIVDPQINTIKAFIQACNDYDIEFMVLINKIDKMEDYEKEVKIIKGQLKLTDIDYVSIKNKKRIDRFQTFVTNLWSETRVIILGVFNSGKTSLINYFCNTDYPVGEMPGTTLAFTETKSNDITLIDSVGQLIDIHKPMMISIDLSDCSSREQKIAKVFDEEISGLYLTKTSVRDDLKEIIDKIIPSIKTGGKIVTLGAGASALVAREIAGQAFECGIPAMVFTNDGSEVQPVSFAKGIGESEGGISRYIVQAINCGDIVIGVSASGGTGFVYDALKRARRKSATTIAITENRDTPVGLAADFVLKSEAKPEGPSSSKIQTAHLVIGHTLVLILADEMGVTADDAVGYMSPEPVRTKKMGIK